MASAACKPLLRCIRQDSTRQKFADGGQDAPESYPDDIVLNPLVNSDVNKGKDKDFTYSYLLTLPSP